MEWVEEMHVFIRGYNGFPIKEGGASITPLELCSF